MRFLILFAAIFLVFFGTFFYVVSRISGMIADFLKEKANRLFELVEFWKNC